MFLGAPWLAADLERPKEACQACSPDSLSCHGSHAFRLIPKHQCFSDSVTPHTFHAYPSRHSPAASAANTARLGAVGNTKRSYGTTAWHRYQSKRIHKHSNGAVNAGSIRPIALPAQSCSSKHVTAVGLSQLPTASCQRGTAHKYSYGTAGTLQGQKRTTTLIEDALVCRGEGRVAEGLRRG